MSMPIQLGAPPQGVPHDVVAHAACTGVVKVGGTVSIGHSSSHVLVVEDSAGHPPPQFIMVVDEVTAAAIVVP